MSTAYQHSLPFSQFPITNLPEVIQGWVLCSHPVHIFSLSFASSWSPDFTNLSLDSSMLWVYWKAICIRLDQETYNVLLTFSPYLQTFCFKIVFPVSKHMIVSCAHGKSPGLLTDTEMVVFPKSLLFWWMAFYVNETIFDTSTYHTPELANNWRMNGMFLFRSHDLQIVGLPRDFCIVYVLISFTINLIQPSAI